VVGSFIVVERAIYKNVTNSKGYVAVGAEGWWGFVKDIVVG